MDWRYLFAGHEELVNEVIAFFTSKATNPSLFQDIVAKCQSNPLTSKESNHATWLKMGRLSIQDFLRYEDESARRENGIPTVIVEAILDRMCEKDILFQEFIFQTGNHKVYTLNEDLAGFLYSRHLVKNTLFEFTYIAENYQRSVFKIVVTTDEGNPGIGTGFLFKVVVNDKVWSLIITNKHVARHHNALRVLHVDDRSENCKEVVCSQKSDVAAIILETSLDLPSFHFYSEPKILDDIITIGYPPVPTTNHSYQLVHKGEINSFVTDYWRSDYFLFSARTSPGNSGGPVVNDMGMVVGIVTQQLLEKDAQDRGKLPYFAAVPSDVIVGFLNEEVLNKLK